MPVLTTNFHFLQSYQVALEANPGKGSEQEEFEHLLKFGFSRGLAMKWQPMGVSEDYDPNPEPPADSVQGRRMAKENARKARAAAQAAAQGKVKSPQKGKKKQDPLDINLEDLDNPFTDEEEEEEEG